MDLAFHEHCFYFHDYETFGADPIYDRPAQFAGIRTDVNFSIIGQPLITYCQPPQDYLPNPEAVLITGITPQEATSKGIPESQFAAQIHAAFSQPKTSIIGYNNIRFDDEVTRHLFYRNFYPPYQYSFEKGNSRWDLLDVVRTYYALRPEGINWPMDERGLPSFRLEALSSANELFHDHAHNALSDVYATIDVAKMLKSAQPRLFQYLFGLRHKTKIRTFINTFTITPLVHISGMLGAYRGNTTWIVPLAWHPENHNAVIVYDLMMELAPFLDFSTDELKARLYTRQEDLDKRAWRVPLKLIHINKCPIVLPAKSLTVNNAERLHIDRELCLSHLRWLKQNHGEVQKKVIALFSDPLKLFSQKDVEGQLYDRFLDPADNIVCQNIRTSNAALLAELTPVFQDARLFPLFFRYKARNYPELLTVEERQCWQDHCRSKFNEKIIQNYRVELEHLAEKYRDDPNKLNLLGSVYAYSQHLFDIHNAR